MIPCPAPASQRRPSNPEPVGSCRRPAVDWIRFSPEPDAGSPSAEEVLLMGKFRGVGIEMVFLVGCAVGGASSRFVVPPANAQQAANTTRWEYFCIDGFNPTEKANQAGAQGWEMVAVGGGQPNATWCFKRQRM